MVTARFPPFIGGVETHVFEVARRLSAMSVAVTVITTNPRRDLPMRDEVAGIPVRRVAAWPSGGDLYFAPGIASWIQRGQFDLIHVQGYHTLVAPLAMAAAASRQIPYVVTLHSGGHSSGIRNAVRPLQTALLGPLLRHARRVIAVSEFESRLFQGRLRLTRERFAVIPNGADFSPPPPMATAGREALIVSIGRLERYKGHHRAIAALPFIIHQIPEARLLIVGSGPFEGRLRRMADERGLADRVDIRSVPADRRSEMAALLSRAGLVTLLSEYESQGIGVMEALAMGAPVLVADSSALADLGTRGLVDTVSLSASDMEIADAATRTMLAGPAQTAPTLPTWDEAAESLLSLYREVVEEPGQRSP
jgi:glycosyltransferase involved in cell wall biosynthesis